MGSQELCVFVNKPDPSVSLGISMVQASDAPGSRNSMGVTKVCIRDIDESSITKGKLFVGDHIVEINGKVVEDLSHAT